MRKRIIVATSIALLAQAAALAEPYFEFGRIPGVPSDPNVEVNLNATLLAFVAEATKESDADVSAALSGIEGIRVRVYKQLEDPVAVAGFIESTSKALERADWERMIYVRDESDKRTRIYVKMNGKEMTGMTVMVVDEKQAVFINIAGTIDPAELGRVARAMGAGDVLGELSDRNDAARRHNGRGSEAEAHNGR
jgi:hypothetical protein